MENLTAKMCLFVKAYHRKKVILKFTMRNMLKIF